MSGSHQRLSRREALLAGGGTVLAVALAGCDLSPGEEASTEATSGKIRTSGFESLGDVRLSFWHYDTFPARKRANEELVEAFTAKYPNVKIDITVKALADYFNTIKLVASGKDAPDILYGNQGYQIDGALVRAKLIRNLEPYAKAYGWTDRFPESLLFQFRFSDDGENWGKGSLYGLGYVGETVGVFYNRGKLESIGVSELPATFADFERALASAKDAGELPIKLGNQEKWPIFHAWSLVQGASVRAEEQRAWVLGQDGATFDNDGTIESLQRLTDWNRKDYFGKDLNAVDYATGIAQYAKGEGVFSLLGNWNTADIYKVAGDEIGFVAMPPGPSGSYVANGAGGPPWHVSSKTKYPDVAAAFLDFVTGPDARPILTRNGAVPARPPDTAQKPPLNEEIEQYEALVGDDGLTLYPDLCTPTMFDTLGVQFQRLLTGQASPEQMAGVVQEDWTTFQDKRKS
jgi:raffinose/stachyose/melibiose transport system substrate-binding protein